MILLVAREVQLPDEIKREVLVRKSYDFERVQKGSAKMAFSCGLIVMELSCAW